MGANVAAKAGFTGIDAINKLIDKYMIERYLIVDKKRKKSKYI